MNAPSPIEGRNCSNKVNRFAVHPTQNVHVVGMIEISVVALMRFSY